MPEKIIWFWTSVSCFEKLEIDSRTLRCFCKFLHLNLSVPWFFWLMIGIPASRSRMNQYVLESNLFPSKFSRNKHIDSYLLFMNFSCWLGITWFCNWSDWSNKSYVMCKSLRIMMLTGIFSQSLPLPYKN